MLLTFHQGEITVFFKVRNCNIVMRVLAATTWERDEPQKMIGLPFYNYASPVWTSSS